MPEHNTSIPPAGPQALPQYASIFEALDNVEVQNNFWKMLGFEPVYDKKGRFKGWAKAKEPSYEDQTLALLNLMASKKSMSLANLEDVEPISDIEVEVMVDLAWELHELLAPPDVDTLQYLPAYMWAQLEMKKALSLAKDGLIVRSVVGAPLPMSSEVKQLITEGVEERKKSIFDKLMGR